MNDRVKKIKTAMETLEYLIDSAARGIGCSGASTEGYCVNTIKDKRNGRKKGFYARDASVIDGDGTVGFSRGDVLEYVEFYHKGDVDNFSLRMVIGNKDLPHAYTPNSEMAKHVTIEAWMALTDGNTLYGAYNMENIEEALNYKSDNPLEQRFFKELNECIVKALKKGKEEIYIRLFGK